MKKIKADFFHRNALEVARDLLGKYLVREFSRNKAIVRIVETEAYMGKQDKASHSYGGKVTPRNKIMYEEGGCFYIYKIYGLYHCLNIVVNKKDIPEAVFIRAGEPIAGIEVMRENRNISKNFNLRNLTSGPARLTQALKIDLKFYGVSVESKMLYFLEGEEIFSENILSSPRINIDYAQEAKEYPWRFYIKENEFVSSG